MEWNEMEKYNIRLKRATSDKWLEENADSEKRNRH